MKAKIYRYPVTSYFVLAYAASWVGSLITVGPKFFRGEALLDSDILLLALPMFLGPPLASIGMTILLEGKQGIQNLISRMRIWKLHGWYLALLIFPLLIVLVLGSLSIFISDAFAPNFLAIGMIGGLLAGFLEEIGWTGFAFPKMQEQHGALKAAIILGLLHGFWHILPGYLGSSGTQGVYWLPNFISLWIIGMTAMRILLVWVYVNTGSLLMGQLMHASSTGFLIVLSPSPISPLNETYWFLIYALLLSILAVLIAAKSGKTLKYP